MDLRAMCALCDPPVRISRYHVEYRMISGGYKTKCNNGLRNKQFVWKALTG